MIYTYKLLEKRLPKDLCNIVNDYLCMKDHKYKISLIHQLNDLNLYFFCNLKWGEAKYKYMLYLINLPKNIILKIKYIRSCVINRCKILFKNNIKFCPVILPFQDDFDKYIKYDEYIVNPSKKQKKFEEMKRAIKYSDYYIKQLTNATKGFFYYPHYNNEEKYFDYFNFFTDHIDPYFQNNFKRIISECFTEY